MRARYSAYTQHEVDFLLGSVHPDSPGEVDRRSTEAWAKHAEWQGLEIIERSGGGANDDEGRVEFVAKFSIKGSPQRHHERAVFRRHNGKWLYWDGQEIRPQPISGPRIKPGRNDDCPCGSARKFKKCCSPVLESGATNAEQLVRARFAAAVTGDAEFLTRSLHPDAKEPADTQADVTWQQLEILASKAKGDDVEIESSYVEISAAGALKKREKTLCRRLDGHWTLSATTVL
jgi:SEC-C motif-containing protein